MELMSLHKQVITWFTCSLIRGCCIGKETDCIIIAIKEANSHHENHSKAIEQKDNETAFIFGGSPHIEEIPDGGIRIHETMLDDSILDNFFISFVEHERNFLVS